MAGKAKLRVFLDSNVIFSGLYSDQGPPGVVLQQAAEGRFITVVSRQVLDEVVGVMAEKLPGALPFLWALLSNLPLEVCENPDPSETERWAEITGADDAPITAAAHVADVGFLVSGDGHFLRIKEKAAKKGLKVVSPSEFLATSRR